MVQLYLITGFLGAGKTTFLKNLIRMLSSFRLRVIVNEFGKEGIDGKLLAELGVALDEINNGSIFCSCRLDKFEEVLENALSDPPEILLVEASGLSDPTNIRKILTTNPRFSSINFIGSICLVDAVSFPKVFHTARVCNRQLSVSDMALINKTDIATPEQTDAVEKLILDHYPELVIYRTSFGEIRKEWLDALNAPSHEEKPRFQTQDITLQKATIEISDTMSVYQLEQFIRMFVEDTYRIKGFVCLENSTWFVDCVGALIKITPYSLSAPETCNKITALAGQGMSLKKSIAKAVEWYHPYILDVE